MDIVGIAATSTAAISLGIACYALISQRKHERLSVAPIGQFFGEGYLHRIAYGIENVGLGPLKIKEIKFLDESSSATSNRIVDLFPSLPEGYYYRNRTDNVLEMTIPKDKKIFFFEMEGDIKDDVFIDFREKINKKLGTISISVTYTDMYLQEYTINKKIKWGTSD